MEWNEMEASQEVDAAYSVQRTAYSVQAFDAVAQDGVA
jgi:hypothetical protein